MKELRETQLQFVQPLDFLKSQLLMNFACTIVWIAGLVWLFLKHGKKYRVIAWTYLGVLTMLLLTNGKDYYTLGAYPMLFAAGGVCIERITFKHYWLRYTVTFLVLSLFIPLIPLALPVWKPEKLAAYYRKLGMDKTGALKWEDLQQHPLPQDFADMLSWREMADKVSAVYASLPDTTKEQTLIICDNYGEAGAVTYYGRKLPTVMSINASFLLWMPDRLPLKNLLLVTEQVPENEISRQFEKRIVLDSITNPFAREMGTKIVFFQNANNNAGKMIEAYVKQKKDEFRR